MKLFYSFGKLQNHLPPTKNFFCTQATFDDEGEISMLKRHSSHLNTSQRIKNYIHPNNKQGPNNNGGISLDIDILKWIHLNKSFVHFTS